MDTALFEVWREKYLDKLILSGLSCKIAEEYLAFLQGMLIEEGCNEDALLLPEETYFETVVKAQSLLSASKKDANDINVFKLYELMKIPSGEWKLAQKAIADNFPTKVGYIDNLYCEDIDWLFVDSLSVNELVSYLNEVFDDVEIVWKIFCKAALLGVEKTKNRITAIMDILGTELGKKVIRTDLNDSGWIFYRFYTDPIAAIRYMIDRGLSPNQILRVIECDSYILYMYKEGCRTRYNHDQERIDFVLSKYMCS